MADTRGFRGFAALLGLAHILSGVESRSLLGGNKSLAAVLLSTDSLLDVFRLGLHSRCGGGLLAFVKSTSGEDAGAGEAANVRDKLLASGHSVDLVNNDSNDVLAATDLEV